MVLVADDDDISRRFPVGEGHFRVKGVGQDAQAVFSLQQKFGMAVIGDQHGVTSRYSIHAVR